MHPNIVRLAVHEDGKQSVFFNPNNPEAVVFSGGATTLTAWFDFNHTASEQHQQACAAARTAGAPEPPAPECLSVLYHDFPAIAVYDKGTRAWRPRAGTSSARCLLPVGRMYFVHPLSAVTFVASSHVHPQHAHIHPAGCPHCPQLQRTTGPDYWRNSRGEIMFAGDTVSSLDWLVAEMRQNAAEVHAMHIQGEEHSLLAAQYLEQQLRLGAQQGLPAVGTAVSTGDGVHPNSRWTFGAEVFSAADLAEMGVAPY